MFSVFDDDFADWFIGDVCSKGKQLPRRAEKGVFWNLRDKVSLHINRAASGAIIGAIVYLSFSLPAVLSYRSDQNTLFGRTREVSSVRFRVDDNLKGRLITKVRDSRVFLGMTQEDLGELVGVSASTVSKFESGLHSPSDDTLSRYKEFLSLSDYLKSKLGERKYMIRSVLFTDSAVFDDLNAIKFSKAIGDRGLSEVYSVFKRIYG